MITLSGEALVKRMVLQVCKLELEKVQGVHSLSRHHMYTTQIEATKKELALALRNQH